MAWTPDIPPTPQSKEVTIETILAWVTQHLGAVNWHEHNDNTFIRQFEKLKKETDCLTLQTLQRLQGLLIEPTALLGPHFKTEGKAEARFGAYRQFVFGLIEERETLGRL